MPVSRSAKQAPNRPRAPSVSSYTRLRRRLLAFAHATAAVLAVGALTGCDDGSSVPAPGPLAQERPLELRAHGQIRSDDFHWLRDDTLSDPAVLAVIEAENTHTANTLAPLEPLVRGLHDEIAGRYVTDSESPPVRIGGFDYSRQFRAGGERATYVRRPVGSGDSGADQVILDVNELARGHEYYRVENWAVSPNGKRVAFLADLRGQRRHVLRVRDIDSGVVLDDRVEGVADTVVWADDDVLVFVMLDPMGRPSQIGRQRIGGPVRIVHAERDAAVTLAVVSTRGGDGVYVRRRGPALDALAEVTADGIRGLLPELPEHRYRLRRGGGETFLLSDLGYPDYALRVAENDGLADPGLWRLLHAPGADNRLVDFEVFRTHAVVLERGPEGHVLQVYDRISRAMRAYPLAGAAEVAALVANPDYDARAVRYRVSSLVLPSETRSLDLATGRVETLSRQPVFGYRPSRYETAARVIDARDGAAIPVTLAWRSDLFRAGDAPLYLIAYGAYGVALDPEFRPELVSLLDRGFVIGIAHVRGGPARGRAWHSAGRRMAKRNTFNDFLDARDALVEAGFGHPRRVFARGVSAGGLVVGYAANVAPQGFAGVIAHKPYVDMLTTLMDETQALSPSEVDEWGDPADPVVFDFIRSISPYDQLRRQAYPAVFATAALQDSSVGYYEALKWIQKLRRVHTGHTPLLIDIDLASGHSGSTETWRRHNVTAREFAFMLGVLCRSGSVCLIPPSERS